MRAMLTAEQFLTWHTWDPTDQWEVTSQVQSYFSGNRLFTDQAMVDSHPRIRGDPARMHERFQEERHVRKLK